MRWLFSSAVKVALLTYAFNLLTQRRRGVEPRPVRAGVRRRR